MLLLPTQVTGKLGVPSPDGEGSNSRHWMLRVTVPSTVAKRLTRFCDSVLAAALERLAHVTRASARTEELRGGGGGRKVQKTCRSP